MPFERGSAGINNVLVRSMYEALGINLPALKTGVSLDLEAFCQNLDTYKQNWKTFFVSDF